MKVASWPGPSTAMGNPFVGLLTGALHDAGASVVDFRPGRVPDVDIVHVHWPEWILDAPRSPAQAARTLRLLATLALARRRGARVVWTVHNLGAHDTASRQLAWRAFVRQVDGFISLTETGVEQVTRRFPALGRAAHFVIPHGHYRTAYPNTVPREQARERLGVAADASVVAFLGQVRPYKNVPELIRTFRALERADAVLLVAGRPSDREMQLACEAAAAGDARVRLRLEFVGIDEVQEYLNAADVVALPYRETLNSGAALLALSFDRPVLAPAAGAFVELARRTGAAWVRTYDGALEPAMLAAALDAPPPSGPAPLDDLAWPCIATRTLTAYRNLRQ